MRRRSQICECWGNRDSCDRLLTSTPAGFWCTPAGSSCCPRAFLPRPPPLRLGPSSRAALDSRARWWWREWGSLLSQWWTWDGQGAERFESRTEIVKVAAGIGPTHFKAENAKPLRPSLLLQGETQHSPLLYVKKWPLLISQRALTWRRTCRVKQLCRTGAPVEAN